MEIVYHKNEHVVIGSGLDLARLVIKQLNRSMMNVGGSLHNLLVEGAISIACYIINEVKESDSQSGGETKVIVIDSKGVRALSQDDVQDNYDKFLGMVALSLAPIGLCRRKGYSKKTHIFPKMLLNLCFHYQ